MSDFPWSIEVLSGPRKGERIGVPSRGLVVGREATGDVDLGLGSQTVSARHALLRLDGDTLWLEDSTSLNGTYVGEQKVKAVKLRSGAVVRFGEVEAKFTCAQSVVIAPRSPTPSVAITPAVPSLPQSTQLVDLLAEDVRSGFSYLTAIEHEIRRLQQSARGNPSALASALDGSMSDQGTMGVALTDLRAVLKTIEASLASLRGLPR